MQTCFDCIHRNIMTNKGDLECHCKIDGRFRNPYRPRTLPDLDCPYYVRKNDEDEKTVRN